jgi:hypothetical protein
MGSEGMHDGVNDEFGNPQKNQRQQRGEESNHQTENHNPRSGLPHDLENRRRIPER